MRLLQLMMRLCSSLTTLSAMSLGRGFPCQPILSSAAEMKNKNSINLKIHPKTFLS